MEEAAWEADDEEQVRAAKLASVATAGMEEAARVLDGSGSFSRRRATTSLS